MPSIIIGSIAAVLLALGLWTANVNKGKLEEQIQQHEEAQRNLKRKRSTLADTNQKKDETLAASEKMSAVNDEYSTEKDKLEEHKTKLETGITDKQAKVEDLRAELAEANEIIAQMGQVDTLVPKIKRTRTEVAELKSDIELQNHKLNTLREEKRDTKSVIAKNDKRVQNEAAGKSQEYLKTTVRTAYTSWGFVILNAGDNQGVVPDSMLQVERDGEVIGKLQVTTVEPNRAAANIVLDQLKEGYSILNGDKVVPEKVEETEAEKKAKAAANAPVAQPVDTPAVDTPAAAPAAAEEKPADESNALGDDAAIPTDDPFAN